MSYARIAPPEALLASIALRTIYLRVRLTVSLIETILRLHTCAPIPLLCKDLETRTPTSSEPKDEIVIVCMPEINSDAEARNADLAANSHKSSSLVEIERPMFLALPTGARLSLRNAILAAPDLRNEYRISLLL